LHTKAKAQREHLLAYAATEASDDEVPGLLALADRVRSDMAAQPAPGPCPISPCDWDAEGTLDDHFFCLHGQDEVIGALVRVALDNDQFRAQLAGAQDLVNGLKHQLGSLNNVDAGLAHASITSWANGNLPAKAALLVVTKALGLAAEEG
jgi:hypothetical protein